MAAFHLAIQQQADAIELDARVAADGQVVVIHDETVDRTTDGTGWVKSLSVNELKKLDAGIKFSPAFQSEKIPTLEEVFESVGNRIFINIELSNYTAPTNDLPDKVISLVKRFGLEENVMFSSYNLLALIRARSLLPKIPIGILTFISFASDTLTTKLIRLGPQFAFHPNYKDVTPALIDRVHRAKSRIHPFTVNQPDVLHQLFSAGIDGVFTDDPPLAQKVLGQINS